MKEDAPTVVIDNRWPRWFAWVTGNGPTIGYVHSVPEALAKAKSQGCEAKYYLLMSDKIQVQYA